MQVMAQETMWGVPFVARETVRVALLGCGGRGLSLLSQLMRQEGVEVRGLFDVNPERAGEGARQVAEVGRPMPRVETEDVARLLDGGGLDLAVVASPWHAHVPLAVAAMERGVHAAVEVPAATTLEGCWDLVNASERSRRHCVLLENCCYGYEELLMLGLARAGRLGEITHGEGAYIHDLRALLLSDQGEGLWRREPHLRRDGNFYPTHGLGPLARCLDIHRGDRFVRLVSMSSREAGLTAYRDAHEPMDGPKRRERYTAGDMNVSLLKTARGRTLVLQHDVVTPRPYSRNTLLQGTKGAFRDYPPGVFFDGQTEHVWQPLNTVKEYEDPLWRDTGAAARAAGGHGGMDFLMIYRLIRCLRDGLPPDIDVYDAAAWSAPGPLSELSVSQGSAPLHFPDFTRGHWETPS
ncbi:MAG: Gfo/Idh/MocA family oxidoreductase [Armatimonadetes bacterium]|nr:Gfo/Idh/MocA family oxidoreductase [Armatimonadota bacterium]